MILFRPVIGLKICQDHAAKEKALQTMSSMSSAQIVSAGSAIHNKMPPALVGPLALASTPASFPGAVSPDIGKERTPWDFFSFFIGLFLFKRATSFRVRRRDAVKYRVIKLITVIHVWYDGIIFKWNKQFRFLLLYCMNSFWIDVLSVERIELVIIIKDLLHLWNSEFTSWNCISGIFANMR